MKTCVPSCVAALRGLNPYSFIHFHGLTPEATIVSPLRGLSLPGNASITGMVARERYYVRVHALVARAMSSFGDFTTRYA